MNNKRVLGIFGLDAAGGLLARRALDAGSALVLHGPSAGREILSRLEAEPPGGAESIRVAEDAASFVDRLPSPRVVMVCLEAARSIEESGRPGLLPGLLGRLEGGDIVIACSGNDWSRLAPLARLCKERGLGCLDIGVTGPSLRAVVAAGGESTDWAVAAEILGPWAAGARVGAPGSGCSAALVRSALEGLGIELLAEVYHVMLRGLRAKNDEIRTTFAEWNSGDLADPLLASTADALGLMDEDGEPLIEKVLDVASARGACSKAASLALEAGVPAPMMAQAACARAMAARKDERVAASAVLGGPKAAPTGDRGVMVEELRKALGAAGILAAAEGIFLLGTASERRELEMDLVLAARLWAERGRSAVLERASEALGRGGAGKSILLDAAIKTSLDQGLPSLRRLVARSLEAGIPVPALAAALASYDCYRSTWLPANLSRALEDSMHGIGFERVDRPRGESFHSEWK